MNNAKIIIDLGKACAKLASHFTSQPVYVHYFPGANSFMTAMTQGSGAFVEASFKNGKEGLSIMYKGWKIRQQYVEPIYPDSYLAYKEDAQYYAATLAEIKDFINAYEAESI